MSKARNNLSAEDTKRVDNMISVDLFFYIYAVAAKSRAEDDDDDYFMAKLQESLRSFKKRKEEVKAVTLAAFSLDTDANPSSEVEKGEISEKHKEKLKNPEVRHPKYRL